MEGRGAIGTYLGEHPAATGEYGCQVERRDQPDEMTVIMEVRPGAERRDLPRALKAFLRQKLGVEALHA